MHVLARSLEPHRILHTCSSHLAHCCLHWAAVPFVDTSRRSWETALGRPLLLGFRFSRDFTELKNEELPWKPAKQTDFQFIGFLNPPILTVLGRKDTLLNYERQVDAKLRHFCRPSRVRCHRSKCQSVNISQLVTGNKSHFRNKPPNRYLHFSSVQTG